MAAKRQQTPRTSQQLLQDERHFRAVQAAQAGVVKRGPKALADNLNRGRRERFEAQLDEQFPGLRTRDPNDFAARLAAANKEHMAKLSALALKAKREQQIACSWCCDERGETQQDGISERLCPKHQRAWAKKFALLKKNRGISPERAAEIDHLARLAYQQSDQQSA